MTMTRTLLFLGTAFLALAEIGAAPARYDQRQEGDFNLQGKLENFLLVVAVPISGNSEALTDLALQALELKQQLSRSSPSKGENAIKAGEEPYAVEVVQISETRPDEEGSVRKAEGESTGTSSSASGHEKAEGAAVRVARNARGFELAKSREVPTVLGYFVDMRKTHGYRTEDGGRARNVVGNAWSPGVEPSLKKQLPRREEEKKENAVPSSIGKDDVTAVSREKQQELRLLGDGIENCGPGRRRDAAGVCQFDESARSLL